MNSADIEWMREQYKNAADPKRQIKIFSELFQAERSDILELLGVEEPSPKRGKLKMTAVRMAAIQDYNEGVPFKEILRRYDIERGKTLTGWVQHWARTGHPIVRRGQRGEPLQKQKPPPEGDGPAQ